MAELVFLNSQRATDWEGLALPGARAFFFLSGTTTPATVYADAALEIPHPTPLEADALGAFPAVWSSESLRLIVRDTDGQVLPGYPIDPVPKGAGTGNGAASVSFEPTPEIAAANVQEAVEAVRAAIPLALQGVGLGNTGNLPSLTPNNVDNAAIPGGFYTLNTATGGALPAGLTGDGGLFWVNRLSAALAIAWIFYPATGRMFFRTQNSTWSGAWRETNAVAADSFWTAGVSTVAREVSPAQVRLAALAVQSRMAIFAHTVEASGTGAQTFTGGAWGTRSLTTTIRNDITGAVLASNELTLPAGTYRFRVASYQRGVDDNFCTVRLFNVTAGAVVPNGAAYLKWGFNGFQEQSLLADIVTEATFAATTVVRIEHRNSLTVTDYTPPFDAVVARLEVERLP
jgi:hypothetical protein